VLLRGCLFELTDSFWAVKARSPNKGLASRGDFGGQEAHGSLSSIGSSEGVKKPASRSFREIISPASAK
jgi:hypothetical protein